MILALWGRDELAADSVMADSGGWGGVTLAYNVASDAEVDGPGGAQAAGATIARAGADLLGRVLRRLRRSRRPSVGGPHNPQWTLAEDGSIRLPDD